VTTSSIRSSVDLGKIYLNSVSSTGIRRWAVNWRPTFRGVKIACRFTADIEERTIDVHIGCLRKALIRNDESDPTRTVRGAGYVLAE
jgi:hypothetical protein